MKRRRAQETPDHPKSFVRQAFSRNERVLVNFMTRRASLSRLLRGMRPETRQQP
jgi:hypothetical protein